jgi:DNA repair protein RadD
MITLWDHQQRGVVDIRAAFAAKHRAVLYVLPTGGGKTILFSYIAYHAAQRGGRVYILTHRTELVDQIHRALSQFNTPHSFIAAGWEYTPLNCMVCSIPSLLSRVDSVPAPTLVIVDETHHARAKTWAEVIGRWPEAKVLGVTATPVRSDGKGLGEIFPVMVRGPTTGELIGLKYLVLPKVFAPPIVDTSGLRIRNEKFVESDALSLVDKPYITGSVIQHYREHANNLPALAFCISVDHAQSVAQQLRAHGYSAISLDGKTHKDIRRGVVSDFRAGKIQVLASCRLFSEGFDVPGVYCGLDFQPTLSLGDHRQKGGRVMRASPGKDTAYWIDAVGNSDRHGFFEDEPEWTLDGVDGDKEKKKPGPKICPKCFAQNRAAAQKCVECKTEFPKMPREVEQRDGSVVEIDEAEKQRRRERRRKGLEVHEARSLDQLLELQRRRGYAPGWAKKVHAARERKRRANADR